MKPREAIAAVQGVPYRHHGKDLFGMDCFGWVEWFYANVHGITITDRREQDSTPDGLSEGYQAQEDWIELDVPRDGCVAVMRGRINGKTVPEGHAGIYLDGKIFHFEDGRGFMAQKVTDITIRNRVTHWMIHKDI